MREERSVVRGRVVNRPVPIWGTYLLVDWQPHDISAPEWATAWHRVMALDGVVGILGGADPVVVADSEVAAIVEEVSATGLVRSLDEVLDRMRRGYSAADRVRIVGGVYDGHVGTCNWYDRRGVNITIQMLGRPVPVYLRDGACRVVLEEARSQGRSRRYHHRNYLRIATS